MSVAFAVRRRMDSLARSTEHMKADVLVLVREGRELVGNLNELARRVDAPIGDASRVACAVRKWTDDLKAQAESAPSGAKDTDRMRTPQVSVAGTAAGNHGSREIQSSL